MILLFGIMRFCFAVPIAGSVVAMLFATFVYVFALLSLGLLVATKAENQMQALQMSMAFILPSVFFSGFIFPRETMPWIFYALGALLPATYFIALMRAIILRGAHFFEYWPHLLILVIMSIVLFCSLRAALPEKNRLIEQWHSDQSWRELLLGLCRVALALAAVSFFNLVGWDENAGKESFEALQLSARR